VTKRGPVSVFAFLFLALVVLIFQGRRDVVNNPP
jgi:hypothetical protein